MPLLTTAQRNQVAAKINQDISFIHESTTLLRADIRAAVDAADQWAEDNAASYNTALPTNFKTGATATMKARLLAHVVTKRFGG